MQAILKLAISIYNEHQFVAIADDEEDEDEEDE